MGAKVVSGRIVNAESRAFNGHLRLLRILDEGFIGALDIWYDEFVDLCYYFLFSNRLTLNPVVVAGFAEE